METESKQTKEQEIKNQNDLSIQIADILNSFGDINEVKKKLGILDNLKIDTVTKWRRVLDQAVERGFFEQDSKKQALNWGCCAVGSKIQIENIDLANHIKEMPDGDTKAMFAWNKLTRKAYILGADFYDAVKQDNPRKAKVVFEKIQALPSVLRSEGNTPTVWDDFMYEVFHR